MSASALAAMGRRQERQRRHGGRPMRSRGWTAGAHRCSDMDLGGRRLAASGYQRFVSSLTEETSRWR